MNAELKHAFSKIKPVCDLVMVCPTPDTIATFTSKVLKMKKSAMQELQQYILFPFITHIKSEEIEKKYELQCKMADAMKLVLEIISVNSLEMCMKIETGILGLVFDGSKPGMVADVPEELKLSAMNCLTVFMLNLNQQVRERFMHTQVALLAQAVFVSVHIAKLERLRVLRLAGIHCLTAHTASHARLTNAQYHIPDDAFAVLVVDTLSNILPGVLAALQDVATCNDNPGHAVVVAALEATHRILCLAMNNKYMTKKQNITTEDFAKMLKEKAALKNREVSSKDKNPKFLAKRSPEWFAAAGAKLTVVTESLVTLRTHEHPAVRKELAVFCYRIISECNLTMQASVPLTLDVLISLTNDDYPAVSKYCSTAVRTYFATATPEGRHKTMDSLCDNFFATLTSLPRILNNIDSNRKLSALNLLHGYVQIMCNDTRPQRLTTALSVHNNMQCACNALLEAAAVSTLTSLAQHATRDVTSPPPNTAPWCRLRHLDAGACEQRLQDTCRLLGDAECADLVLDRLLDMFQQARDCEIVYLVNWMGSAPNSSPSLVQRILTKYIEEDVWYSPLEVASQEAPLTSAETFDVAVYNPRSWSKESVPGLYEGATETRYTDISYLTPRTPRHKDSNSCATLAKAQRHMVLSCLLTEGVGVMARRLMEEFQPYLLKTLCLILERVGSKYEMLHLAGLKAMNDIAHACGHSSVAALIRGNADYFTNQVTLRLKKAWNSESALQILTVVMEYSDATILDCLYGIVENVLIQSCDKYHEKDLHAYLQVFLTFVNCIRKWFPLEELKGKEEKPENTEFDVMKDAMEYEKNVDESERLMSNEEFEKETGKSVEEMYKEDQRERDDNVLDYDDTVAQERAALPQHVCVTRTILRRCVHFVCSRRRDETILALQVLTKGLPVLRPFEDELLPLVHQIWAPLVVSFERREPAVLRCALRLLVSMADLSKDFIRNRTLKEVLPQIYKYLGQSAQESYLKDAGSAYRSSQAFGMQLAALTALPSLAADLALEDERLEEAMTCVDVYLSNKQPKPLQALAVYFFRAILSYDYGACWLHLRRLCNNDHVVEPPQMQFITLEPVVGTPYSPANKDYENNINLIFSR